MNRLVTVWFWAFAAMTGAWLTALLLPSAANILFAFGLGVLAVFGVVTTIVSLTRCKKCGGWHDSAEDEQRCGGRR